MNTNHAEETIVSHQQMSVGTDFNVVSQNIQFHIHETFALTLREGDMCQMITVT